MPFLRNRHDFLGTMLAALAAERNFLTADRENPSVSLPRRRRTCGQQVTAGRRSSQTHVTPPTFNPTHCVNILSVDYNLDTVANDRPKAIANHVDATHEQWADGFNLPDNFFSTPCLGCVSNLGRNTFVGPGYWNLDTSLFKNFRLSDRFSRLQFRAEAFNIFNHTNFRLGAVNSPSDNNKLNSPEFGKAGGTFSPRNLQFGLKLSF